MSLQTGVVFLNGDFLPAASAAISPLDRGFLYGDGLFETIRIYAGVPFALEEHLRRLKAAGRDVRLRVPYSVPWWRDKIATLLAENGLEGQDAAVRLTISRGVGGDGLVLPKAPSPTILMMARRLPPDLEQRRRAGVKVTLLGFHPGAGGLLEGLKTTDYLTAAIGKTLAQERHAFEGLYQTQSGEILEGTTSNVFVVSHRGLMTPALSRGVLPGTTRDRVLLLARRAGMSVREIRLPLQALLEADEAFLTASTIEVVPIRRVDDQVIGNRENPVTREIQRLYTRDRKARAR
jgi:branched-subunit amino acid aminotransferase/4-amino-4-deoxychorismate lyase